MPPRSTPDDTTPDTSAAGADLAQGTPDEPDAPAAEGSAFDLVQDEATGRLGLSLPGGLVLWLGEPERYELPLRKVVG